MSRAVPGPGSESHPCRDAGDAQSSGALPSLSRWCQPAGRHAGILVGQGPWFPQRHGLAQGQLQGDRAGPPQVPVGFGWDTWTPRGLGGDKGSTAPVPGALRHSGDELSRRRRAHVTEAAEEIRGKRKDRLILHVFGQVKL